MYYLFGAGNNCCGALKFFGKENIIGIVDNNDTKAGTLFEDVPILSFAQFIESYHEEMVIVTAYIRSDEIISQLKDAGVTNYYVCPYMQSGFWSAEKIVNTWNLSKKNIIAIYEKNPITDSILYEMETRQNEVCEIIYLSEEEKQLGSNIEADVLLIVSEEYEERGMFNGCKQIFDLYREMRAEKKAAYKYLEKYRNIQKGKDCFIVGNGPSLRKEDLEKIHKLGIASIGCNGIYRMFSQTKWRPNYYVIGDAIVYEKNRDRLPREVVYFMRDFYGMATENKDIAWYDSKGEKYYPGYPKFSDDLVSGVYGGRTVTYDMLQVAVYMGFENIYLIGVDFSHGEDGKSTHFYESAKEDAVVKQDAGYREEIEHAYISARRYAEEHGIKIYNATRGGNLEVFERKDLDQVLDKKL